MLSIIDLSLFDQSESRDFLAQALRDTQIVFSAPEIDVLLSLSGGHPYLLQLVGRTLFETYRQGVPEVERLSVVTRELERQVSYLIRLYWERSTDPEKILLTALALIEKATTEPRQMTTVQKLQTVCPVSVRTLQRLEHRSLLRTTSREEYGLFSTYLCSWIVEEITATLDETRTYQEWLQTHHTASESLTRRVRRELNGFLPRVATDYRPLFLSWARDPAQLVAISELLRLVLGIV